MKTIEKSYGELEEHILALDKKFIASYIPANPSTKPSEYSYDVRAYCVLSHAAFEEFVESVVLSVINQSVKSWTTERKSSDVISCLLCWHGTKFSISDNELKDEKRPFDLLREAIDDAKSAFSIMVKNNHGISLKHLRVLLTPANIEMKQDVKILGSLKLLTSNRGDYAHNWRAKNPLAPEDARAQVADVLELCKYIKDKAIERIKPQDIVSNSSLKKQ